MMKRLALAVLAILLLPAVGWAQSYTIMPTPFQTEWNLSGQIVVNGCIWTYAAGTTNPITTYADTIGTANLNPIRTDSGGRFTAYLLAGANYKLVYEASCSPPSHGTVYRTADNIAAVPPSASAVDVIGTAGASITLDEVVYLSDGSGGKTAGQWYPADSAQAYSSSTPIVGLATVAIGTGLTGAIRLRGELTGLGVTLGTDYYIGTAGSLTSTPPAHARFMGRADTASSLIVAPEDPQVQNLWVDDFRLTFTTATPVTTADVTGASAVTIYCSPFTGNRIDLPDANGNPIRVTSGEFSIAVPATTGTLYDIYVYDNASVATLELLAATNDTTRATNTVRTTNGRWLKSGDNTRLYLGSFRTTGVSGQGEDSAAKRWLWNEYNRVLKPVAVQDATASWAASGTVWRQGHGAAGNQIDVVVGQAEDTLTMMLLVGTGVSSGGPNISIGIGADSATVPMPLSLVSVGTVQTTPAPFAMSTPTVTVMPAFGRHFYAWLEATSTPASVTFYGAQAAGPTGVNFASGIQGLWRC